jgi:hypothetical protein
MSSDLEGNSEASQDEQITNPRKKTRISALIDMLRDDSHKSEETMRLFIAHAEQDRLDRREKWEQQNEMQEKEYNLRMRQLDLEFAKLKEKELKREHKK